MDIKEATQAAAPRYSRVRMPRDNAERVVEGARHLAPNLGQRMIATRFLERAVFLIARVGCSTRSACRNVGLPVSSLSDQNEVRRLCDARNIPRRHHWGMPYPKTIEGDYPVYVKPRAK